MLNLNVSIFNYIFCLSFQCFLSFPLSHSQIRDVLHYHLQEMEPVILAVNARKKVEPKVVTVLQGMFHMNLDCLTIITDQNIFYRTIIFNVGWVYAWIFLSIFS